MLVPCISWVWAAFSLGTSACALSCALGCALSCALSCAYFGICSTHHFFCTDPRIDGTTPSRMWLVHSRCSTVSMGVPLTEGERRGANVIGLAPLRNDTYSAVSCSSCLKTSTLRPLADRKSLTPSANGDVRPSFANIKSIRPRISAGSLNMGVAESKSSRLPLPRRSAAANAGMSLRTLWASSTMMTLSLITVGPSSRLWSPS